MKTIDLRGKTAIVTGGGSSIGAAITLALNRAGCRVVIAQRSEPIEEMDSQCDGGIFFQRTDISEDQQLDALIKVTLEKFGGLDIIVNNSAVADEQGYMSSRQQWRNTMDINVISPAILVQKALPALEQSDVRAVVNISSCSAEIGTDLLLAYPASKAAINTLTRCLAAQLAERGIRANAVAPGATVSEPIMKLTGNSRELADQAACHAQPLDGGRLVDAEEIGDAVLFLCSDMAKFITGIVLPVDGGFSALGPENTTASIFGRLLDVPG